jgi:hypothetical protein
MNAVMLKPVSAQHRHDVCEDCAVRPEVRRLGPLPAGGTPPARCRLCGCRLSTADTSAPPAMPRPFTVADRSLIRRMGNMLPAHHLLELLNDRLIADLGPDAPRYTEMMLSDALREAGGDAAAGGGDWASLRRVLAKARRDGLLQRLTPAIVEDFAVIFSLSPAQALRLRETILSAQDTTNGGFAR